MKLDNLSTLTIHRLSKEQYKMVVDNNKVDPYALYLTPEEELDIIQTIDSDSKSTQIPSATAAKSYVDNKITKLIADAPEQLDTLNELAQALGKDKNFSTTILNKLKDKADKTDLTAVAADLDTAEANIVTANGEISTLKSTTSNLTTQISELSSNKVDKTAYSEKISEVENSIKDLQDNRVDVGDFNDVSTELNKVKETVALKANTNEVNLALNNKVNTSALTETINDKSTKNQIPTAKATYETIINYTTIPSHTSPNFWELADGWHFISGSLKITSESSIAFDKKTPMLKQGNNFTCWDSNGGIVVGESNGTQGTFTRYTIISEFPEDTPPSSGAIPTAQAVLSLLEAYEPVISDWDAEEGEPGFIKNKPFETTSSGSSTPDILIDESTVTNKEWNETGGYTVVESWAQTDVIISRGQEYTIIYTTYDGEKITSKATAKTGQEMGYDSDHPMADVVALSDSIGGLAGYSYSEYFVCNYPDYYSKIEIYVGEPSGTTKIQYQYIETVNEITESTGEEEIPTVQAIRDFIRQEIENSLYIDEEDYV